MNTWGHKAVATNTRSSALAERPRDSVYLHTVSQKNVTTFSNISWIRTVRLQRFSANLLPRL